MASQGSPPRMSAKSTPDPILRNTLRYTISAKEYETLHKYIISRSKVLKRNAPTVAKVERLVEYGNRRDGNGNGKGKAEGGERGGDDPTAAAVRASLRVFVATGAALKLWGIVGERFLGRREGNRGRKMPFWKNANFRLSLSLSTIVLLHRMLFRFFTRLRAHLLLPESKPFRQRNKRTTQTLTSSLAPAVGASLAGIALAVYPADQLRVTIAIYALSRATEFAYNHAEEEGWIWGPAGSKWERPWWWGSWLTFPVTCGQLLHAFVFDPDCFPESHGKFILKNSRQYVHQRPEGYPSGLSWPNTREMVDKLGVMAKLNYPPFTSPILFPNTTTIPPSLATINPLTSSAHPLITALTCATLHPSDPSCLRTYLKYWIRALPPLLKFFSTIFVALSIPKYRSFFRSPYPATIKLLSLIARYSAFVAGSIGTSWAAICFFQEWFPRSFLKTQRFFLGGMLGGLWGWIVRGDARGEFLYGARTSIDSLWKVGRKRGWWRGVRGGDVGLFVASLMVVNVIYERDARSITSGVLRRGVSSLRGEGLVDVVAEEEMKVEGEGK